jgi:hypothetical protein
LIKASVVPVTKSFDVAAAIPKPVWAVGFALEQPLRDATLACSASGISKQLEYNVCQLYLVFCCENIFVT